MKWDAFISHASEDKQEVARPLAEALSQNGLRIWFDETTSFVGDSLRRKIDHGLSESRFGIVILSPSFFAREWPQRELDGLVAREIDGQKVVLPVWHNVSRADVQPYSPVLADRLGIPTTRGLEVVAAELVRAIQAAPAGGDPVKPASSHPVTAAALLDFGERKLREGDFAQAEQALNTLLQQFPQSQQAVTTRKLISLLREGDAGSGTANSLRVGEASRILKMFQSMDAILRGYGRADRERQEALEQIFGAEMFRK